MTNIVLLIEVVDTKIVDELLTRIDKVELGKFIEVEIMRASTPFTVIELQDQVRSVLGQLNKHVVFVNRSHALDEVIVGEEYTFHDWIKADTRKDLYEHLPIEVQNWLTSWRQERDLLVDYLFRH